MSTYIWLPPRFLQDRDERGLDNGTVTNQHPKSHRVLLRVTDTQLADIEEDAEFQLRHSNAPRGVKHSARVTLQAIGALRAARAVTT